MKLCQIHVVWWLFVAGGLLLGLLPAPAYGFIEYILEPSDSFGADLENLAQETYGEREDILIQLQGGDYQGCQDITLETLLYSTTGDSRRTYELRGAPTGDTFIYCDFMALSNNAFLATDSSTNLILTNFTIELSTQYDIVGSFVDAGADLTLSSVAMVNCFLNTFSFSGPASLISVTRAPFTADVVMIDCTFNSLEIEAGGTFVELGDTNTVIIGCDFGYLRQVDDFTSSFSGVITMSSSSVTINDTVFHNNLFDNEGGVLSVVSSTVVVHRTNFTENSAASNGASVFMQGDAIVIVSECAFVRNSAMYGGDVLLVGYNVFNATDTMFVASSAIQAGGTFHAEFGDWNVHLLRSSVSGCSASQGSVLNSDYGPGLFTATDSVFENNLATSYGAFYGEGAWIFHACTFSGNSANGDGGVFYAGFTPLETENLIVDQCVFTNNGARNHAGIGVVFGGRANFSSSTFTNNFCSQCGIESTGGIETTSSTTIFSCLFNSNSGGNSAALKIRGPVSEVGTQVISTLFFNNTCMSEGAVVVIGTMASFVDVDFVANHLVPQGGFTVTSGLYIKSEGVEPGDVDLLRTTFVENNSTSEGGAAGALAVLSSIVNITDGYFADNIGAIGTISCYEVVVDFFNVECTNSQLAACLVLRYGIYTLTAINVHDNNRGGLDFPSNSYAEASILDSEFYDNSSPNGGAITGNDMNFLKITGTTFLDNTGGEFGGSIALHTVGYAEFSSVFAKGGSARVGGFLACASSYVILLDTVIDSPTAVDSDGHSAKGGAMACRLSASLYLVDSVVRYASVDGDGSAVYLAPLCATFQAYTSLFRQNIGASTVLSNSSTASVVLSMCDFVKNEGSNATVRVEGTGSLQVNGSMFYDNVAFEEGPVAIDVRGGGDLSVNQTLFWANSIGSTRRGAPFDSVIGVGPDSRLTVEGSTFRNSSQLPLVFFSGDPAPSLVWKANHVACSSGTLFDCFNVSSLNFTDYEVTTLCSTEWTTSLNPSCAGCDLAITVNESIIFPCQVDSSVPLLCLPEECPGPLTFTSSPLTSLTELTTISDTLSSSSLDAIVDGPKGAAIGLVVGLVAGGLCCLFGCGALVLFAVRRSSRKEPGTHLAQGGGRAPSVDATVKIGGVGEVTQKIGKQDEQTVVLLGGGGRNGPAMMGNGETTHKLFGDGEVTQVLPQPNDSPQPAVTPSWLHHDKADSVHDGSLAAVSVGSLSSPALGSSSSSVARGGSLSRYDSRGAGTLTGASDKDGGGRHSRGNSQSSLVPYVPVPPPLDSTRGSVSGGNGGAATGGTVEGGGEGEFPGMTSPTVLGRGGQAVVYSAFSFALGYQVCLKVFNSPESCQRELSVLATVPPHPNVVAILSIPKLPPNTMAMKLAPKGNLGDHLTKSRLARKDVVGLALGIATGLKHLHSVGVCHLDIKPSNILLATDNKGQLLPIITDFGASFVQGRADLRVDMCTVKYAAPEVLAMIAGKSLVEAGVISYTGLDVYAFGVTVWEMETGQSPHAGLDATQVVKKANASPEDFRVDLSLISHKDIQDLVDLCTRAPDSRVPEFDGLIQDLLVMS